MFIFFNIMWLEDISAYAQWIGKVIEYSIYHYGKSEKECSIHPQFSVE